MSETPQHLSGGERQRIGIARALLTSPKLLLMDQPLAALDSQRKNEILPYLERLHDELDIPVLYVSHAQDEVARLADHIVLLSDGKALASGPIGETLARLDLPLRAGDDAGVVINGTVSAYDADYQLLTLHLPDSALSMRVAHAPLAVGKALRVKVQARDVSLSLQGSEPSSILNRLPVTVIQEIPADNSAHVLATPGSRGHAPAGAHHPLLPRPVAPASWPDAVGTNQGSRGTGVTIWHDRKTLWSIRHTGLICCQGTRYA